MIAEKNGSRRFFIVNGSIDEAIAFYGYFC